jgi:Flp pilus assembly pilin Flp
MRAAASKRRRAAVLRDESGAGFADYSLVLGFFAVQCICGALAVNDRIGDIIHTIAAVFS